MGVPSFFRWLTKKYPTIIVDAVEEKKTTVNGVEVPVDATKPNPNYQEFDNLYLDMNGIIHPCTHPENRPPPKNEEEMFVLIFEYIDRLFSIVRPRRLLYMAIDGVAPRAKMNQQRSRRFRAAKEAAEKEAEIQAIRDKLEAQGIPLPPKKKEEEKFDSNCITPGTPFMDRLAIALRYYIHLRVSTDPAWAKIEVILSDANTPGEGEHKIMDFIRRQRASPTHDPNTVHCLCGADADLIMLGLATHEVNFNILREEFVPNQPRACDLCHRYGHELKECRGLVQDEFGDEEAEPIDRSTNFIFIRLPILREYLANDLQMPNLPFEFNLERAIDDWVFMCFFVGNDFLPHLPSLEIRENAIDKLIRLYKDMVYRAQGWLTDAGTVNPSRVQIMMKGLGEMEDHIFVERQRRELRFREREPRQRGRKPPTAWTMPDANSLSAPLTAPPQKGAMSAEDFKGQRKKERLQQLSPEEKDREACAAAEDKLKALLNITSNPHAVAESGRTDLKEPWMSSAKRPNPDVPGEGEPAQKVAVVEEGDQIRLYEPGFKERYYQQKFDQTGDTSEFRRQVARDYFEGLCWVLRYYYQGCASWDWFYPHHYAPFASDFDKVGACDITFDQHTKPFHPLEQLMAVFPAASRSHIPEAWHWLMTQENSPLIDFYPEDFDIDLNGKRFAWQGVALLPFVNQDLLLTELAKAYSKLTDEEKLRNICGPDRLFVGKDHAAFQSLIDVHETGKAGNFKVKTDPEGSTIHTWIALDPANAYGMAGEIAWEIAAIAPGEVYPSVFRGNLDYKDVNPNECIMVAYRPPQFSLGFTFPAILLENAVAPEATLKPRNYNDRRDGPYRPMIGFTRDRPTANLSDAGHRHINHAVQNSRGGGYQQFQGRNDIAQVSYNESTSYNAFFERGPGYSVPPPGPEAYSGSFSQMASGGGGGGGGGTGYNSYYNQPQGQGGQGYGGGYHQQQQYRPRSYHRGGGGGNGTGDPRQDYGGHYRNGGGGGGGGYRGPRPQGGGYDNYHGKQHDRRPYDEGRNRGGGSAGAGGGGSYYNSNRGGRRDYQR